MRHLIFIRLVCVSHIQAYRITYNELLQLCKCKFIVPAVARANESKMQFIQYSILNLQVSNRISTEKPFFQTAFRRHHDVASTEISSPTLKPQKIFFKVIFIFSFGLFDVKNVSKNKFENVK